MSVPIISSQRATAAIQGILAESRVVDMHDEVLLLEPDNGPLVIFTTMASRKSVHNPKFDVLEDQHIPRLDASTAGNTNAELDLGMDDSEYWQIGDIGYHVPSGEMLGPVTATTATEVTFAARSLGSVAAATIITGDAFKILAPAYAEGVAAPAGSSTQKVELTNYTQIVRKSLELTGTDIEQLVYGKMQELPFQQKKKGQEWHRSLEETFLFSDSVQDLTGNTPIRYSQGLNSFITENRLDYSGNFTYPTFLTHAESLFRYGSETKIGLFSRGLMSEVTTSAFAKAELVQSEKALGMKIFRLNTPHGDLMLKRHHMLEGGALAETGLVFDPKNVGYRFMRNRDVKLKTNIQNPDVDGRKDEFIGEVGLWVAQVDTHGALENTF